MVSRADVDREVRSDVEVLETGRWFIAEGSFEGRVSAAQGESREEAIDSLVSRFWERVEREEECRRERERVEAEMRRRRELSDARMERALEESKREVEAVKRRFGL